MYILTFNCQDKQSYFALDRSAGGYPYWTSSLRSAEYFKTINEAYSAYDKWLVKQPPNGELPNYMIHTGLELSHKKLAGVGSVVIQKIHLLPVATYSIKWPPGPAD